MICQLIKPEVDGFSKQVLKHKLSYLGHRRQCVVNGGSLSFLKQILLEVPQGSILSSTLSDIFIYGIRVPPGLDPPNLGEDYEITALVKPLKVLFLILKTNLNWMAGK